MPVVEGQTDAVQTQALEEGGIGIGEEVRCQARKDLSVILVMVERGWIQMLTWTY